ILNECIKANDFSIEMIDKLLERIKGEELKKVFRHFLSMKKDSYPL
ncbi:unnamed protein product, partial [marine sediment metagenome]